MTDRCISACAEKDRIGVKHGWCAVCVEELQQKMRALYDERDRLRAALVGLVGASGREELEQMEAVIRLAPAPAEDKAVTIDAIHALMATL